MKLLSFAEHCKLIDERLALLKRQDELLAIHKQNGGWTPQEQDEVIKLVARGVSIDYTINTRHKALQYAEFNVLKVRKGKDGKGRYCQYKDRCPNNATKGIAIHYKKSSLTGFQLGAICDECLEELRGKAIEREPREEEEEEAIEA